MSYRSNKTLTRDSINAKNTITKKFKLVPLSKCVKIFIQYKNRLNFREKQN